MYQIIIKKLKNKSCIFTLLSSINCTNDKKKIIALLKGPGNKSKYTLSLLLFFAYGGLPRGKKILRIWTESSIEQKIYRTFSWRKSIAQSKIFSRQKTYIIHQMNIRHHSKAQTFFPRTNFPPKDLAFFGNCSRPFWKRNYIFIQRC